MRSSPLLAAVLTCVGIATPALAAVTTYKERSYGEIVDYLLELGDKYPGYSEVFSAQDKYNLPKPKELQCTRANKTVPCEQYVIKITNESSLPDPQRPELIFSGALHGDERVGPQAVVALAELLLDHAAREDGNSWIKHLVNTRTVVIVPTTNAHGYNLNEHEENNVDPNRDFPYNLADDTCMVTMTARAVNELWRDHLFQLGITFHGGTRCVSYEWGAYNHILPSDKSEKSPDDRSQEQLARIMTRFGGRFEEDNTYYPDGPMTDIVYAVDGGMEDWGYAASWENDYTTPKPIGVCNPTTYGGYPKAKTVYNNATHRAFNILIETSDSKQPDATALGDSSTLSDEALSDYLPDEQTVGHVPRNVRLSLLYIDLVQPYLLWKSIPSKATVKTPAAFSWEVAGSITVDSTQLKVWMKDDASDATLTKAQSGVTRWYHKDLGMTKSNNKGLFSANVNFKAAGTYFVQAIATVDQDWTTQGSGENKAVPDVGPQSHIVNARTNKDWEFSNNGRTVKGQTEWSSPVTKVVVV